MPEEIQQFTELLQQSRGGSKGALDQLMPVIYDELRRLAGRYLRSERKDHTLRATALVNEAYVRLVNSDVTYQDRVHFYAVAARTLRHILVDYAKHGIVINAGAVSRTFLSRRRSSWALNPTGESWS